jgi:hypothetical protein
LLVNPTAPEALKKIINFASVSSPRPERLLRQVLKAYIVSRVTLKATRL